MPLEDVEVTRIRPERFDEVRTSDAMAAFERSMARGRDRNRRAGRRHRRPRLGRHERAQSSSVPQSSSAPGPTGATRYDGGPEEGTRDELASPRVRTSRYDAAAPRRAPRSATRSSAPAPAGTVPAGAAAHLLDAQQVAGRDRGRSAIRIDSASERHGATLSRPLDDDEGRVLQALCSHQADHFTIAVKRPGRITPAEQKSGKSRDFKPPSGLEPLTPSLRVKCSTS